MARIIIIGGIESTFNNAETLYNLGEEIVMFYTRGKNSPGWEGVDLIDTMQYPFYKKVPVTEINGNINDHINEMQSLQPDVIYSLGWQQIFSPAMFEICSIVGIHESLLPKGAGAVPIANAILHDEPVTGITLFYLDGGIDTGDIILQLKGQLDPRKVTATDLYKEAMELEMQALREMASRINIGTAPRTPQNINQRTVYKKINWQDWAEEKVSRARTYPYV